jgi:hypothetical protein
MDEATWPGGQRLLQPAGGSDFNAAGSRNWNTRLAVPTRAYFQAPTKENADTYNSKAYAEAVKSLATVLEGAPEVRTYQLAYSTFYKIAVGVAANQSSITNPIPGVGG